MNVNELAGVAVTCAVATCLALASSATSAVAAPVSDVLPAPGAPPVHLRVSSSVAGPSGPQAETLDFIVRRTSPASAVLQRNTDITPLDVLPDGTLRLAELANAAQSGIDFAPILTALAIAHDVTGAPDAGDRSGWTAEISLPSASGAAGAAPAPAASPSPAPQLAVPIREIAASAGNDVDLDGAAETTLASSAPPPRRQQRAPSGGYGGGGFGGRRGFGGQRGEGEGQGDADAIRASFAPTVVLDLHVTGHIMKNAVTRLQITQTRRVVIDGLTYSNVGTATIEVER